ITSPRRYLTTFLGTPPESRNASKSNGGGFGGFTGSLCALIECSEPGFVCLPTKLSAMLHQRAPPATGFFSRTVVRHRLIDLIRSQIVTMPGMVSLPRCVDDRGA